MKHGKCDKCKGAASYSELYDVYYCNKCMIYLEDKCSNSDCCFCPKRPDRVEDL